jgi:hypothetical protein
MVARGLILPVIDGLDEMDTEDINNQQSRSRALLDLLNKGPWRDRSIVVICRATEFAKLTHLRGDRGLHGATTITLQPLDAATVSEYLTIHQDERGTGHPAWEQINTHLETHPTGPLAANVRNPWLLGLAAATLHHTPSITEDLVACSTEADVRELLFAAQIPAAVSATDDTGPYRDYSDQNVERWLRSLALCLQRRRDSGRNGTTIRLDEIYEIAGTNRIRVLHALTVGIAVAIVFGLAVGTKDGLGVGLGAGTAAGLSAGFLVGIARYPRSGRIVWSVPGRSRWRRGVATGGTAGITLGLAILIWVGIVEGLVFGATLGVGVGVVVGFVVGILAGIGADAKDQLALGVNEQRIVREDLQAAISSGIVVGLVVLIPAWITAGLKLGLVLGIMIGLYLGLTGGLNFGLPAGLEAGNAAGRYYLAALAFRFTNMMPSHPAVFLDWARRNSLLRVTGAAYQFRHDTYQQWILSTGCRPQPASFDLDEAPAVRSGPITQVPSALLGSHGVPGR